MRTSRIERSWRHLSARVACTLFAALTLAVLPAAEAKRLTTVVVVGADWRPIEVPIPLLTASPTPAHPAGLDGGFLLAYPLMDGGLPARPARVYPSTAALCSSWDILATARESSCSQLTHDAVAEFVGLNLPGFQTSPPSLRRVASLRSLAVPSNYVTAIELAFHRWRVARVTARPQRCVKVKARWQPRGKRPTAFCLAERGAWVNGKLYPYPRAVCRAADLVGSVFAPALPECV